MKEIMLTNQAIARGAYEAGVGVISSYPGTPSTEITEYASGYSEMHVEWAPNEKVALEVGLGSAIAGVRAMVCMKHVGLNVSADPLFTASYTGINAGLVIVVADDPGMASSQNEQDSRFYARSAHIPMLEPSNAGEAKDFVKFAFELSENYDTPVLLRTTTGISHSGSYVTLNDREELPLKPYVKDIKKYTMMPACARGRHVVVDNRERNLKEWSNIAQINHEVINDTELGIVCSGVVYEHVLDALPNASVFKVGLVYPIPIERIRSFSKKVKRLVVIEELEPFFEDILKAEGISCEGKGIFSNLGDITVATIKERMLGESIPKPVEVPSRPPIMCAGCPHRGVFYILNKLKLIVNADIGCYTLGAQAPLSSVDTVICMGASIGMAHGFKKASNDYNNVAVIGDSTFIHSGITGLINAVYNQSDITVIILDNSTTGMTGHQDHPATGKNAKGEQAPKLDIKKLVEAIGVASVDVVDSYALEELELLVKRGISSKGVSVIIAKRDCELLKKGDKPTVRIHDCRGCKRCLKLGCPAIVNHGKFAVIDSSLCVGCGLCEKVCPFGCIKKEG